MQATRAAVTVFRVLDADHDGTLSANEVSRFEGRPVSAWVGMNEDRFVASAARMLPPRVLNGSAEAVAASEYSSADRVGGFALGLLGMIVGCAILPFSIVAALATGKEWPWFPLTKGITLAQDAFTRDRYAPEPSQHAREAVLAAAD